MPKIIPGLQNFGIFALHCEVRDDGIFCAQIKVQNALLTGRTAILVDILTDDKYTVRIPSCAVPPGFVYFAENVFLPYSV